MASSVIINFRVSACKLDNFLKRLLHVELKNKGILLCQISAFTKVLPF